MKRLIFAVPLLFQALIAQSQITLGDWFGRKQPAGVDTNYYPFYNDVQMIEIDNVGAWEADVAWHETTQPRALTWSMLIPGPLPNVYLFRNKSGTIVKAFNTNTPLDSLTLAFRKIPIDKKSSGLLLAINPYHKGKYHSGWYDYHSRQIDFNGFYKVYNPDSGFAIGQIFDMPVSSHQVKVGLIDSLGNIFLPWEYDDIQPLDDNILLWKGGKCGILNKEKKFLVPMEFDGCDIDNPDGVAFTKDNKVKLIFNRQTLGVKDIPEFDYIGYDWMEVWKRDKRHICNGLFPVRKNGKCGLVDSAYNVITPLIYDYCIPAFREGLVRVNRNKLWGYIDTTGKEVIPCIYEDAEEFKDGIATVSRDGKYYCINSSGKNDTCSRKPEEWWNKREINPQWRYINGYDIVHRGHLYGVMDSTGRVVVPLIYERIEGIYSLTNKNKRGYSQEYFKAQRFGKYGIIDVNGNELLPFVYDDISGYGTTSGCRMVKNDKKWGMVNASWEEIVPCIYDGISMGWDARYVTIMNYVGGEYSGKQKNGLMDMSGKIIVPMIYDQIWQFKNNRALVQKDSLFGFIDTTGNVVIPIKFQRLNSEFHNGLCLVYQNGKAGFIDTTGTIVIPCIYDDARVFTGAATGVKQGEKWALIDRKGKLITDFIYDHISYEWYRDGEVQVRRDGKLGYINAKGKVVIPIIYDDEWGYGPDNGHLLEKDGQRVWVKAK